MPNHFRHVSKNIFHKFFLHEVLLGRLGRGGGVIILDNGRLRISISNIHVTIVSRATVVDAIRFLLGLGVLGALATKTRRVTSERLTVLLTCFFL